MVPPFLRDGGRSAERILGRDWSATALGPVGDWPVGLRTLLATLLRSPVPMAMLWGEAPVLFHNDAYAAMAGHGDLHRLGEPIGSGLAGDIAFDEEAVALCRSGRCPRYRDRERTLIRNGRSESAWFDCDYSPLVDDAGVRTGVICVVAETTDRVAAARRAAFLLQLADDLRAVATPAAIMALAAERLGEKMAVSRVFYAEITRQGWMTVEHDHARGVGSIVGRHSLESFGPDLLAAYRHGAPVVVRDVAGDTRLSDGARAGLQAREVSAFIDVVLFQEDEWVGLLAVQNATARNWSPAEEGLAQEVGERVKAAIERTRAEIALRELQNTLEQQVVERTAELRRYHAIVEAISSPICAFDTGYRLLAFNRAHQSEYLRVMGTETRIGDYFPDQFSGEQRNTMLALMRRALTGESFTVTAIFGRSEGDMPTWELSYTPLRDDGGRVIGAFHQATNVTGAMAARAELEIAQEALRQSQKVEAMGSLTGGVAHDFNNLLTPIIGSLDMLMRKEIGNARERRLIDGALQSAERAKTLVQRLLAFARRQPLQPIAVDLPLLVHGMVDLIGATVGPNIALAVDVESDLPPARADANQLEMALLNLAVNARDAMPAGGALTISVKHCVVEPHEAKDVPAGNYICLGVADSGIGMDEATRRRAIEPFFSTKGVGKGTGLGLSMVHGLAAQLGGGLTIDSTPGEGTHIALWLPLSDRDVAATRPPVARPDGSQGVGTVLLVDDEELVRLSTADMLADLGYRVVEAGSAAEAIDRVDAGLAPDFLVTDHLMPGATGAELVGELCARLPALKALIVSGYAETDGIDPDIARLSKPFRNEELAASLAALDTRPIATVVEPAAA
ncbi:hybrid sensor histidine kinase/response regulator [Sphingomonas metalli]|uniref:histidine kinase n=1 Tax=Sphingomonas metalli TaxID=1779358 RepID=A0A916TD15_9SPHN|nr:ATP-binding protein [Sphingomonas metalli]GGB40688.1 hybrid sensor histidine kinase/response regulator [Sphingomonas metalli]